jgi:hypothetical protein
MKLHTFYRVSLFGWNVTAFLAIIFFGSACSWAAASSSGLAFTQNQLSQDAPATQDKKSSDPSNTRLKILVTNSDDKPVGNASVYVRFNVAGGFLHKDKLADLSFKTNSDGSVKVPEVPQGKILIQVIAKGLHTYGKWYDIQKDQDTIEIKLEPAPHWY